MPLFVRLLVGAAALLLVANMLFGGSNSYTREAAVPSSDATSVVELHGAAAAAASEQQRVRRIAELEQQLVSLRGAKTPSGSAAIAGSSPAAREPQQVTPSWAAASTLPLAEVHMPPPPPPFVAEVVPLAERVDVPAGESLPDALRAMRKGTDLFISFASANMGTRGAVERASMAHAAHSTQPPLTSGVRCACAQRRLRSTGWRICARRVSA